MKVHYVDDDDADLTIMLAMAKKIPDIEITTSRSLEGLLDRIENNRIDCVLLDINRPDTKTLEDDIEAITRLANVPVVLVTGGAAGDLRLRGTLAGADGVIEKSALSRDLLTQVLHNARARVLAKTVRLEEASFRQSLDLPTRPLPQHISRVCERLDEIENAIDPEKNSDCLWLVFDTREKVRKLRYDSENEGSVISSIPMRWALKAAIDNVSPFAAEQRVHLRMGPSAGTFSPEISRKLGYLGLQYLLEGTLAHLRPHQSLVVSSEPGGTDEHTLVELTLSEHYFVSPEEFVVATARDGDHRKKARVKLWLATALLGLTAQNINVSATPEKQFVRIQV